MRNRAMLRPSSKGGREAEATRPVRTVFLRRGATTDLHRHAEPSAWTRVVSGRIVDERWHEGEDGALVREERVLRADQALAAPTGALHRVRALEDTAFVTSCSDECGCAQAADADEIHDLEYIQVFKRRVIKQGAVGLREPENGSPVHGGQHIQRSAVVQVTRVEACERGRHRIR